MACACTMEISTGSCSVTHQLLAKTHRCLVSRTYSLLCVISLVLSLCSAHTMASFNPPYSCPVELEVNHTNYCECNVLLEMHCYNLESIPKFYSDGREYAAVHIENQDIGDVPSKAFVKLQVHKISLNYSPFGDAISGNAFRGLETVLEELQMAKCGIKILPAKLLSSQDNLKVLHLWGNEIEIIPDNFFDQTSQLRELTLWGNKIKQLNSNTFAGLWKLKKLDLDNNNIKQLNELMFRHLGHLEALYLGGNQIGTVNSDTFIHTTSLKVLKLNDNGMEYMYENALRGLKSLKVLNLQHNRLDMLFQNTFTWLENLNILLLQYNRLERVWFRNFDKLQRLQEVHLSHNQLPKLSDRLFRGNNALTHLFVDYNGITELKKCMLPRRPRLKILSVVGNPIQCDCRLSWVLKVNEKGTDIWGNCLPENTPAETLTSITDEENYDSCRSRSFDCRNQ